MCVRVFLLAKGNRLKGRGWYWLAVAVAAAESRIFDVGTTKGNI